MRYGLVAIFQNKIVEIKGYSNFIGFEELDENKLNDIVKFTTSFQDHNDLINFLKDTLIIPNNTSNIYFKICLFRQNNVYYLPFTIPYKKDLANYDIRKLQMHFSTKIRDIDFWYHFINEFYSVLKDVPIYRDALLEIYNGYTTYETQNLIPNSVASSMYKFIQLYCTRKNSKGEYVINFLNMHKLVTFLAMYNKSDTMTNSLSDIESVNLELRHYNELLRYSELTVEQMQIYEERISYLEGQLEFLKGIYQGGRK